jgi:hypothetical protein
MIAMRRAGCGDIPDHGEAKQKMREKATGKNPLPGKLDEAARRDIADCQAAMRMLLERLPRRFDYAEELDFVFRPGDEA